MQVPVLLQLLLCLISEDMMTFFQIFWQSLLGIIILMTVLWLVSIRLKNVSIVDLFWGAGFVICCAYYYFSTEGFHTRKVLLLILVALWGLRLSLYLTWRNTGKGEDFRYRKFREDYGEHRYWWISFFQTFLLQGVLMWLISAPLLGVMFFTKSNTLGIFDYAGMVFWVVGISFEAGGDFQLARFKADPGNKGKVMNKGFWRYTRHPNYFGDTAVWLAYGLFCLAAGSYLPLLGSILMTLLIIKVSGVALLERTLKYSKPEYKDYQEKTSAFLPWFPKK
jgi:steroid 5-alpha reductase family enzyme